MAYLRVFMGDTLLEQRELGEGRVTIGRADDNDIVLKGPGVSKYHAVIEGNEAGYAFIDQGSANGSFIAGRRVDRHPLAYWDEVQIFNYVLKFMAVARARGEEAGSPTWAAGQQDQEATMEVEIASLGDLAKLKRRINVASLVLQEASNESRRFRLDKVNFAIGKAAHSDIRLGGWLTPRIAARIQRRNDGFHLLPGRRAGARLNGEKIRRQVRLSDGDVLIVRGLSLVFLFRPQDAG